MNPSVDNSINTQNPDPTVMASELVSPPIQVEIDSVAEASNPSIAGARTISDAANEQITRIDTEESRQRDDILNILGDTPQQNTAQLRADANRQFGVNEAREELSAQNLRLTSLVNSFDEIDARIQSASGQSDVRQAAQLGQLNRERAVEVKAQAAIVTALQGNYALAAEQANQAVADAQADRKAYLDQLDAQYERLSGIVDEETQQVLDLQAEERSQERAFLQQVTENVSAAVATGAATQAEIQQLTNANTPDEQKMAVAQAVQARAAQEQRSLDQQQQRASIANIYDQMEQRRLAAREKQAAAASVGDAAAEQRKADTEQALQIKGLAEQILTESGLSSSVGFGFQKSVIGSIPFVEGNAIAGTQRADFEALATRLANLLTLDNLDLMSGVLSETDIKILETAGSNLRNFDQSETQYVEEVNRIISTMDRTIGNNGITAEQAQFYGQFDQGELSEIDAIFQ